MNSQRLFRSAPSASLSAQHLKPTFNLTLRDIIRKLIKDFNTTAQFSSTNLLQTRYLLKICVYKIRATLRDGVKAGYVYREYSL